MAIETKFFKVGTDKIFNVGSSIAGINPYAQGELFIQVANITNPTQQEAIRYLVKQLVDNELINKFNFIYPFIGGDATRHSYNLINPSLYQLTFFGGWTHSTSGATPNGTNAYANTGFIPTNISGTDNGHMSYYSRTNSQGLYEIVMGSSSSGLAPYSYMQIRDNGNRSLCVMGVSETNQPVAFGITDSTGLFMGNFQSNTLRQLIKNKTVLNTNTVNLTIGKSTSPLFLGSNNNNGTGSNFTNKECAFSSVGNGMSNVEQELFYDIVQQFQTILGRNV